VDRKAANRFRLGKVGKEAFRADSLMVELSRSASVDRTSSTPDRWFDGRRRTFGRGATPPRRSFSTGRVIDGAGPREFLDQSFRPRSQDHRTPADGEVFTTFASRISEYGLSSPVRQRGEDGMIHDTVPVFPCGDSPQGARSPEFGATKGCDRRKIKKCPGGQHKPLKRLDSVSWSVLDRAWPGFAGFG